MVSYWLVNVDILCWRITNTTNVDLRGAHTERQRQRHFEVLTLGLERHNAFQWDLLLPLDARCVYTLRIRVVIPAVPESAAGLKERAKTRKQVVNCCHFFHETQMEYLLGRKSGYTIETWNIFNKLMVCIINCCTL